MKEPDQTAGLSEVLSCDYELLRCSLYVLTEVNHRVG
jgi:hypothetical protein